MSRNPNADQPQPIGLPDLPPTHPNDPLRPDPSNTDPVPLPPDTERQPPAPVREPDMGPPAGDPQPTEPTRLV